MLLFLGLGAFLGGFLKFLDLSRCGEAGLDAELLLGQLHLFKEAFAGMHA